MFIRKISGFLTHDYINQLRQVMVMVKKGIIFSDVDGTLCFHKKANGVTKVSSNPDGTVNVKTPAGESVYKAHDLSTDLYEVYLDLETQRLGRLLQREFDFIYVTGGRFSTVFSRKEKLDFSDGLIIESGGVILDNNYQPDLAWSSILEPEKKYLSQVEACLKSKDWVLDTKGRTVALRVRKDDNPKKSDEEFRDLCAHIELPSELKKTINMQNLDVILRSAGKDNAVNYLMDKKGYNRSSSIGIGDDINDIDMLNQTDMKYVLGSGFPEIIVHANERGWYVSAGLCFDGINEILRNISRLKK
jgi:hydroxymethylpyrimidine pyrophosphatase-like HAD family hydrolase